MNNFIEVNEDNFNQEVINSEIPVLVEFGADWCVPCKRMEPLLQKFHDDHFGKMRLAHINVDQAADLTMKFQVQSIPTLILFVSGEPRQAATGLQSSDRLKENFSHLI